MRTDYHISGAAALAVLILGAATMLLGCSKQSLQTTYDNQDKKIDQFIQSQLNSGSAVRVYADGGVNRLVAVEGEGTDSLSTSGTVTFFYTAYTFSGSVSKTNIFSTNDPETIKSGTWSGVTDADTTAVTVNLQSSDLVQGLRRGLFGVRKGENCMILFSGKYGFGNKSIGTIPANSALLYDVRVTAIDNGK